MTDRYPFPFALDSHPAKADPALIHADAGHFAKIAARLTRQIEELTAHLIEQRRAPGGRGQAALDRDLEIHRITARLRLLQRFGVDLCLGRMVGEHGTLYVGRLSLIDQDDTRLLIDWRAPAAEPFFAATHARPLGLRSRRRYRWTSRRITDYWDEAFTDDADLPTAALDDHSAFIASLAENRSARMRDVLGTIQADQDAIIRSGSRGSLVVDGGPGTGKTVVALHRAAHLLYAEDRLRDGQGAVLVVGPSAAYTSYVADILPGLGEDGVRTCTVADLVPEGERAVPEADRRVAALKSDVRMPGLVDRAVRLSRRVPSLPVTIETGWGDVQLAPADWDEAIGAAEPAATHNDAREEIWQALLGSLAERLASGRDRAGEDYDRWPEDDWSPAQETGWSQADDPGAGVEEEDEFDAYGLGSGDDLATAIRTSLAENAQLLAIFDRAWPLLDPSALVARLWSSPTLLQDCGPWLEPGEVEMLSRKTPQPWTRADLPLLDRARLLVGDPETALQRRRVEAEAAADRARFADVIADLIATDDSEMAVMSMLRGQDLRHALDVSAAPEMLRPDSLAGPYAHIVVDEAQELTAAEWQMLLARNPSRSFTIVGDRAQARHGFTESWRDRLAGVSLSDVRLASLTVNYRTPTEVMAVATPVIRSVLPDATVPVSVRSSGIPVRYGSVSECAEMLQAWLTGNPEGIACVLGGGSASPSPRVAVLEPRQAKGLEFDLVMLVEAPDPDTDPIEVAVDRYVAMTRTTRELILLS